MVGPFSISFQKEGLKGDAFRTPYDMKISRMDNDDGIETMMCELILENLINFGPLGSLKECQNVSLL